ncbi:MAG TPA: M20/M25/M40 family metallo-hydrolase [Gemmatimonadaceae bacterium]|nr:M20/M25/M40 family metallo-hydrolase [Gemmatimonadaceae bacterium]
MRWFPNRSAIVLALTLLAPPLLEAQTDARVRAAVRAYTQAHDVEIVSELADFLATPNLASDSVNIRRNAAQIVAMLRRRGATARLLESPGSPPAVFGELRAAGAAKTIVFYAHYDGQPVDTTQWATKPWSPTLRSRPGGAIVPLPASPGTVDGESRLYARSAGDDKSPIIAFLAALDALKASNITPSVNLKFFFEGEEEAGSPHIREMLSAHRELLAADLWIFGDGPVHQSRRQQVVFGVRGTMGLELTTYGPARALHSGHYGNWAPNPLVLMANLLASVRDPDGRILIDHFYDDIQPISATERAAIATVPPPDSALRVELQLAGTEAGDAPLMERIMLPALNVRGINGGNVGALAANAIATTARASIDFRLVPRQTPENIRTLFEAHARKQGFFVTHSDPTPDERMAHQRILKLEWEDGYPAQRTNMSLPVSRAVVRAVEMGAGAPVIVIPTFGGSAALYHFDEVLHAPLITVPIVNHDNNQHAANENLRLQNLFDGMQVYAALVAHLGRLWTDTP